MGLNFPNVSHVVMYGAPDACESIVQQVGRAGRNGLEAHAVLYNIRRTGNVDQEVHEVLQVGKTSCFRKALFDKFEENSVRLEPGHKCCTSCHKTCSSNDSGGCAVPVPSYEVVKSAPIFDISEIQPTSPQDSITQTDLYFLNYFDKADYNSDSESDDLTELTERQW